jgi:hypothetical protein
MPIETCPICDSKADALRRELANERESMTVAEAIALVESKMEPRR